MSLMNLRSNVISAFHPWQTTQLYTTYNTYLGRWHSRENFTCKNILLYSSIALAGIKPGNGIRPFKLKYGIEWKINASISSRVYCSKHTREKRMKECICITVILSASWEYFFSCLYIAKWQASNLWFIFSAFSTNMQPRTFSIRKLLDHSCCEIDKYSA